MSTTHLPPAKRPDWRLVAASGLLLLLWNAFSWHLPFFWDTVLNSKIATWYWETGFSRLTVPEGLDAGHPPFFSLYLGLAWTVFGRSLPVSHMAMLPWLAILLWNYHRLASRWLDGRWSVAAAILLFCEPTFMAQASMVTPDIALVAMLLLVVNSLLDGRRAVAAVAMLVMAAMSMRGILMLAPTLAIDVALAWQGGIRKPQWRKAWPYALAALSVALWFWLHWRAVGWLITPPAETYGGHRQVLGFTGMLRNVGLVGWRFLDFGRAWVWLLILVGTLAVGWRRWLDDGPLRQAGMVLLLFSVLLAALLVPFSNPIGHRYFLAGYLLLIIGLVRLLMLARRRWLAGVGLAIAAAGLLTGNLWIYPRGIAQGWDSSLAYLPFAEMRANQRDFLLADGVNPTEVCTTFPLLANPYYSHLEDSLRPWYRDMEDSTAGPCKYVLYSNMAPGFSAEAQDSLERGSDMQIGFRIWNIELVAYKERPQAP